LSTTELTPFAYEVLALVGRDGAGAHDLLRMARRSRFYAMAGESQYYTEPKRLAALGYLDARRQPGKTRERTVYTLTDRGLDALRAWTRRPARPPRLQSEGAVRVLAADLVGDAAVRDGLGTLRADIAELEAQLDEAEARADALPHRRRYLMLNHRLARRLLAAHLEWLDEVERELDGADPEPAAHASAEDSSELR
jgi:PadR family transcriptional regulator, regulatory protein AphA